jgi:hypothetical protein
LGVVDQVKEFVIPFDDLVSKCREFSLELVASYKVRDKLQELLAMHPARPTLDPHHWTVLDLYRTLVFQKL